MSNPLQDLIRLFDNINSVSGKVFSFDGTLYSVATSTGIVTAKSSVRLNAGDPVMISNGNAIRVQISSDAPVYFV